MSENAVIPFGKYKGQPVETILADQNYVHWLLSQPWFQEKFTNLYQVVINYGAAPQETPEHNAMQVLFLDDAFCLGFVRHMIPGIAGKITARAMQYCDNIKEYCSFPSEYEWARSRADKVIPGILDSSSTPDERIERQRKHRAVMDAESLKYAAAKESFFAVVDSITCQIGKIDWSFSRSFEVGTPPIDVLLQATATTALSFNGLSNDYLLKRFNDNRWPPQVEEWAIEIKPLVADDYPSTLRQMKASRSNTLLVKDYSGSVTRDQFIGTFKASGIRVIFLSDVG